MVLAKGIFNMLQIQDPEVTQLNHDQQSSLSIGYLAQHPALDLPFRSYFLLSVTCSIFALGIWAAYFNGLFSFCRKWHYAISLAYS